MLKQCRVILSVIIIILFLMFTALVYAEQKIQVTVSILPQKYFVEKIAGSHVDIMVMVPPGAFPGTYEPKPQQMIALSKSKIYFAIGVPFEKAWLPKIAAANPEMLIVHTDEGIKKIPVSSSYPYQTQNSQKNDKEDSMEHTHRSVILDPHIWLAPSLVKIQVRHIVDALIKVDPLHKDTYKANCQKFISELDELDRKIRKILGSEKSKEINFLVFHPAWGYFAREYGLRQIPVEIEGKEPGPKDLRRLIEFARSQNIRVIFVQPQVSTRSAETIARAIKGSVVIADPLAPDWAENLLNIAHKIKSAVK